MIPGPQAASRATGPGALRARSRLGDLVVVVTGASSGIGLATARGFAGHGARVVLAARGEDALSAAARECRSVGGQALAVPTDISDHHAVDDLAGAAVAQFGRVDVWVNAAAGLVAGDIRSVPPEEGEHLFATNVGGTIAASRAALRLFDEQGHGTLINVSSLLGVVPNPRVPVYCASKFAIRGLTLCLRRRPGAPRGVHVCLVLPSAMDTPIFRRAANHTGRRLRAIAPAAAPERAAAAIVACARRPRRQITVGVNGRAILAGERLAPRLTEWLVAKTSATLLTRRRPAVETSGALFSPPAGSGATLHGGYRVGRVRRRMGESWGRALLRRP